MRNDGRNPGYKIRIPSFLNFQAFVRKFFTGGVRLLFLIFVAKKSEKERKKNPPRPEGGPTVNYQKLVKSFLPNLSPTG